MKKIFFTIAQLILLNGLFAQITTPKIIVEKTDDITLELPDSSNGKIKLLKGQLLLGDYIANKFRNLTPNAYLTLDALGNVTTSTITANNKGWLQLDGSIPDSIDNDIYTEGNVGIGTTNPLSQLDFGSSFESGRSGFYVGQAKDPITGETENRNDVISIWSNASNGEKYGFGIHGGTLEIFSPNNRTHQNVSIGGRNPASGQYTDHLTVMGQSGKVGIGTTNPKEKLEVNGNVYVSNRLKIGGADLNLGLDDGRDQGSTKFANRALVHFLNDVLIMNYDGDFEGGIEFGGPKSHFQNMVTVNDKLGIGNTNPTAQLDFGRSLDATKSGFYAGMAKHPNSGDPIDRNDIINIWSDQTSKYGFGIHTGTLELFAPSNLPHQSVSIGGRDATSGQYTDHLTVRGQSGNVGIGTTNPNAKLEIRFDGATSQGNPGLLTLTNKASTVDAYASLKLINDSDTPAVIWRNSSVQNFYAGANSLNFGFVEAFPIGFVTGNKSRMVVAGNGNVGIGTTTPISQLDFGASFGLGRSGFYVGQAKNPINGGNEDRNDIISIWSNASNEKYGFGIHVGTLEIFSPSNHSHQNVSIGGRDATSGQYIDHLTVKGQSGQLNLTQYEGNLNFVSPSSNGKHILLTDDSDGSVERISPVNLGVTSLRASKENFAAPVNEVIDWLKNAEVKFYNYREDQQKTKHAGVMADDFSKLGLGTSKDQNAMSDMIGVLYMIVKEQQQQIETQQQQINQLMTERN